MSPRLTHHLAIDARRESPEDVAAVTDFALSWTHSSSEADLPAISLAYCADFAAERVLFTQHDPAALTQIFAAPFLFAEQLASALCVTSVPFEIVVQLGAGVQAGGGRAGPAMRPLFIFSPGRTGSTLLTRLLGAAGMACASEPDMLTQIARMSREDRQKLPAGMERQLACVCIAALGNVLGPTPCIKLRSQCNARPLTFIEAAPDCRAIFMLRGMQAWALSRHRAFQEPAVSVAAVLRQAMDALDKLAGAGVPFDVLWFETLVSDPLVALQRCWPDIDVRGLRLGLVMAADSQEGTGIARDLVGAQPVQQGFIAEFAVAWTEARAGAEWDARTEELLERMWQG